jgi:hypothetical protein
MPQPERFALELERMGPAGDGAGGVLRVHRIRVAQPFERRQFTYRVGQDEYRRDFYNQFAAPPGVAIREVLVRWLRDSGTFTAVLDAAGQAPADWLLEGQVDQLYVDMSGAGDPAAVFQIELSVLDARSTDLDVAFQKRYGGRVEAASTDPEAYREAWRRVIQQVLALFEADLRDAVARGG